MHARGRRSPPARRSPPGECSGSRPTRIPAPSIAAGRGRGKWAYNTCTRHNPGSATTGRRSSSAVTAMGAGGPHERGGDLPSVIVSSSRASCARCATSLKRSPWEKSTVEKVSGSGRHIWHTAHSSPGDCRGIRTILSENRIPRNISANSARATDPIDLAQPGPPAGHQVPDRPRAPFPDLPGRPEDVAGRVAVLPYSGTASCRRVTRNRSRSLLAKATFQEYPGEIQELALDGRVGEERPSAEAYRAVHPGRRASPARFSQARWPASRAGTSGRPPRPAVFYSSPPATTCSA